MSIPVKMGIYNVLFCLVFINGEQFTGPLSFFASFPNKMIPAEHNSLTVPKRTTLEQCASECILRASGSWDSSMTSLPCFAFEYIHTIGICIQLKVSAGLHIKQGYEALNQAEGTTYYELAKSPVSLFLVVKNHTLSNKGDYSRIINNVTLDTCVYICYTSPGMSCSSFAYNNDLQLCAISHVGFDEKHRLRSARGYGHYQYTGNWPCNVTLPWRYSPRVIASKKYPYVTNSTWSCEFKLIAPIGQQVRLNVTTFYSKRTHCADMKKSGVSVYDGLSDNATVLSHLCSQSDCVHPPSVKSSSGTLLIRIKQELDEIVTKIDYDYEVSDSCDGHHCRNGATCVAGMTSYHCACVDGFSGQFCQENVDDCKDNPCLFNGRCVDGINTYTCECLRGSTGKHCEQYIGACYTEPCKHGNCTPTFSGIECACKAGYTGTYCEYDVNECYSSPCDHGKCIDLINGFRCDCDAGFTGVNCNVDKRVAACHPTSCQFGTCAINESGSFCQCFPGFTGSKCDVNMDDCLSAPCNHGSCVDHVNAYTCKCEQGYVGKHCDIFTIDPCRGNPCKRGYCSVSRNGFNCVCHNGYSGRRCDRKLLPCDTRPCANGHCHNVGYSYACECFHGYTGTNCSTEIELCNNSTCVHGTCYRLSSIQTVPFCKCMSGFTGDNCDAPFDHCNGIDCSNGHCVPIKDGYKCECEPNYTGTHCNTSLDICSKLRCSSHGSCILKGDKHTCMCDEGFRGDRCEIEPTVCEHNSCFNGGTCILHDGGISSCACLGYYTGLRCEKFITTTPGMIEPETTGTIPSIETHNGSPRNSTSSEVRTINHNYISSTEASMGGIYPVDSSPAITSTSSALTYFSPATQAASTAPRKASLSSSATTSILPGVASRSPPIHIGSYLKPNASMSPATTSSFASSRTNLTSFLPRVVISSPVTRLVSHLPGMASPQPPTSGWIPNTYLTNTMGHGKDTSNTFSSSQLHPASPRVTSTKLPENAQQSTTQARFSSISPTYVNSTTDKSNNYIYGNSTQSTSFTQLTSSPLSPTSSSINYAPRIVTHIYLTTPQPMKTSSTYPFTESFTTSQKSHMLGSTQAVTMSNKYLTTTASQMKLIPNVSAPLPHSQRVPASHIPATVAPYKYVTGTTIGCFGCDTQSACNNNTCIHGTCSEGIDEDACVCRDGFVGRDCSVAIIDETADDVITAESAIIGVLGIALVFAICIAVFIYHQHRRRGSIYITSQSLQRRDDTGIKKRYSSRDVHSELMAQRYSNPTFVSTDETVRKTHCRREQGYFPPSPKSSSSENSQSTSSSTSRGQWYEPIQTCNNTTPSILQSPSLWEPRDIGHMRNTLHATNVRQSRDNGNYSVPKPTINACTPGESKPSAFIGSNIQRSYKSENIPETVRTACEQPFLVTDKTLTSLENPFFRLEDGGIALRLSTQDQRSADDYQTLLDEILEHSDYITLDSDGKRMPVQHISGTENGKSDA